MRCGGRRAAGLGREPASVAGSASAWWQSAVLLLFAQMAPTLDNIIGALMFPLIMLVGVAAFVSTVRSKGTEEMTTDDCISAVLAGSTVLVGGSFHVFPMNHGEAGTAAVCILMPFGGLAVLGMRAFELSRALSRLTSLIDSKPR